jgi:hypothetical protein
LFDHGRDRDVVEGRLARAALTKTQTTRMTRELRYAIEFFFADAMKILRDNGAARLSNSRECPESRA